MQEKEAARTDGRNLRRLHGLDGGLHLRPFRCLQLLLCSSEGTKYEHFIHTMVEIEVEGTHRFVSVLQSLGHTAREIDPQLEHILVSGMFSAFFEMVVHDMPQQQATRYVKELREFYTAGWQKIMGL